MHCLVNNSAAARSSHRHALNKRQSERWSRVHLPPPITIHSSLRYPITFLTIDGFDYRGDFCQTKFQNSNMTESHRRPQSSELRNSKHDKYVKYCRNCRHIADILTDI